MEYQRQRPSWFATRFPTYNGWGCFLTTVIIGLISIGLLIGIGGPLYHDCDHQDCTTQQNYGMYCDDYCWYGNAGPGSGLTLIIFCGILLALAIPFCWTRDHNHHVSTFDRGYSYDAVDTQIIF